MSRVNSEIIKVLIEARKVFQRQPERVAYFQYERDSRGCSDEKRIQYVVMKDHYAFGAGYSFYDRCWYLATFDDRTLDLFEVGLAASTAPPKPDAQDTASASALSQ